MRKLFSRQLVEARHEMLSIYASEHKFISIYIDSGYIFEYHRIITFFIYCCKTHNFAS